MEVSLETKKLVTPELHQKNLCILNFYPLHQRFIALPNKKYFFMSSPKKDTSVEFASTPFCHKTFVNDTSFFSFYVFPLYKMVTVTVIPRASAQNFVRKHSTFLKK